MGEGCSSTVFELGADEVDASEAIAVSLGNFGYRNPSA